MPRTEDEDDEVKIKLNKEYLDHDHPDKDEDFIENSIKTRLYFTSESHLHSLVNSLRYINVDGVAGQVQSYALHNMTNCNKMTSLQQHDSLQQHHALQH